MDDQANGPRASEDASDLQQRQAALRALAQSQQNQQGQAQPSPREGMAPNSATPMRRYATAPRACRPLAIGGAVVIIVALVAAVVAGIALKQRGGSLFSGSSSGAPTSNPTLSVQKIGLACVSYVSWSPDGSRIAVLGDVQGCGSSTATGQTAVVYLLDAKTHKLIAQLQPDAPLFKSPAVVQLSGGTAEQLDSDQLFYNSLLWSPDSQSLLMSFFVTTPVLQQQQNVQLIGLLRLGLTQPSLNGVWVEAQPSPQVTSLPRVDLTSGAIAQIPAPTSATAYRWNSDGTLAPVAAAANAANAPIGSPADGASFSIWQPGILLFGRSQQNGAVEPTLDPHEIDWSAQFAPLSPDGRYCYLEAPSAISLIPPTTQQATAGGPSFAPRDPALLELAKQMLATSSPNLFTRTLVSWRPDGRYLAASNEDLRLGQSSETVTVSIYDTTTGKLVTRLSPNFAGMQPTQTGFDSLSWSPDGKRLLLADNFYGALTIWGPDQLPH